MDNLSKKQRSNCMSRIKKEWTKQEILVHNVLKGNKIKHKMHPKINGSPDLILQNKRLAVFLNGCFWHKCKKCYKEPKSNKVYWIPKINRNVSRDKENALALRRNGWKVVSLWEHQVNQNVEKALNKICER